MTAFSPTDILNGRSCPVGQLYIADQPGHYIRLLIVVAESSISGRFRIGCKIQVLFVVNDKKTASLISCAGRDQHDKYAASGSISAIFSARHSISFGSSWLCHGYCLYKFDIKCGEPGADDAAFYIRGIGTLGNTAPLIVIDGIPGIGRRFQPA